MYRTMHVVSAVAFIFFANAPARAVEIFNFRGVAFVGSDGENHGSADEVRLTIDYEGGAYRLSGFGLNAERVRPYFTSFIPFTRRLIFRSIDPKSKMRPEVIIDRNGWAHLRTVRLRRGRLNVAGHHRMEAAFFRQTFVTNSHRIPVTFANPVARAYRACARILAAAR